MSSHCILHPQSYFFPFSLCYLRANAFDAVEVFNSPLPKLFFFLCEIFLDFFIQSKFLKHRHLANYFYLDSWSSPRSITVCPKKIHSHIKVNVGLSQCHCSTHELYYEIHHHFSRHLELIMPFIFTCYFILGWVSQVTLYPFLWDYCLLKKIIAIFVSSEKQSFDRKISKF